MKLKAFFHLVFGPGTKIKKLRLIKNREFLNSVKTNDLRIKLNTPFTTIDKDYWEP